MACAAYTPLNALAHRKAETPNTTYTGYQATNLPPQRTREDNSTHTHTHHVEWGAAEGGGHLGLEVAGEAKVGHLADELAVLTVVQQHVLGLEVPVYDVVLPKV